jgi:hypothetical protein
MRAFGVEPRVRRCLLVLPSLVLNDTKSGPRHEITQATLGSLIDEYLSIEQVMESTRIEVRDTPHRSFFTHLDGVVRAFSRKIDIHLNHNAI